jgi:hypothetical protein
MGKERKTKYAGRKQKNENLFPFFVLSRHKFRLAERRQGPPSFFSQGLMS